MKNPLISVVTICFNASVTLEQTILSVLSQSLKEGVEYIIVDGGSTDGSLQIIEKYRNRVDVILSEPDDGIYNAMNKAAGLASGEYIIYMNSNDVFASENILERVKNVVGDKEYSVIFGDYYLRINNNKYLVRSQPKRMGAIVTSHQAIFCKKSLVLQYRFDEKIKLAADYQLVSSLLHIGPNLCLNFPVCIMEGVGFSSDKKNQILREYFTINKKLYGSIYASYVFSLTFLSMLTSNILTFVGLGFLRNYLRRLKGWRELK